MASKDDRSSPLIGLTTRTIGRQVHHHDSLPSTDQLAAEMASKGAREGTVIIARQQTAGVGRMGRTFASPPGGLYLSVVLRPKLLPEQVTPLPLVFGLSVVRAIGATTLVDARLKWPNDVLVSDRKVCGIMARSTVSNGRLDNVITGVGINVNSMVKDLPVELQGKATTLREVTGNVSDMDELARNLLYFMDLHYHMFMDGMVGHLLDEWSERSSTLKRSVRVEMGATTVKGTALGLDSSGGLLVRTDDGIVMVPSGDCFHI